MPDIRERFEAFDRLVVPDLWDEAQRREPLPAIGPRQHSGVRKVGVIVAAFALTVATTGIVIRAFHGNSAIRPVSGSPNNWPTGSVPQLGLSFRYPPQWRLQPFREEVGVAAFVGTLISDTDLEFHHPAVRAGSFTSAWDMNGLPADGVAISIENITGAPPAASPPTDTPLPLSLSDKVLPFHRDYTGASSSPRVEQLFLSFVLNGRVDDVRVFFGPHASAQSRRAAAEVVASIMPLPPNGA
jgi:hypothetical protein